MEYFEDVVDFVNENFIWVIGTFLVATFIEFLIFMVIKRDSDSTNKFGISVCTNIFVILGAYILSCLGVGLVNCIKDQDWHLWTNYIYFMNYLGGNTILIIVLVIFALVVFSKTIGLGLIAAVIATGISFIIGYFVLYYIIGFLLYLIVYIAIIILKILWFVVSGFFVSIYQFVTQHWDIVLISLFGPGVLLGLIYAGKNYVVSFMDNILKR